MIPRILEPEVMDTAEEAVQYDQMDHAEVNRQFVDDLTAAGPFGNEVLDLEFLDLGTGTAQIPVELCRRNPAVRVLAVDMATHMLRIARDRIEAAKLGNRIRVARFDAKQLPLPAGQFDCVMSNSIVHHIPEPQRALGEAVRVAADGGLIYFRDLLRPTDEASLAQLVAQYAGDATAVQRKLFADSLHASLRVDEMRQLVGRLGFSPETVRQTSDRHWTWEARK